MVNRSRCPVSPLADLDGPPAVLGGPAGRGDPVPAADVLAEAVLVNDLIEVGEDLLARGDRRAAPRLEPVAVGEQVAVGAHTRVPMGPPGSAAVVLGVQDDEGQAGELLPQVVRGADAGDPGTNDEDVDVTGVLDLPGAPGGSGCGCNRRHGWTSGTRALLPAILAPTFMGAFRSTSRSESKWVQLLQDHLDLRAVSLTTWRAALPVGPLSLPAASPPGRVPLPQVPQLSPQRPAAWPRAGLPGGNPPAEDGR